MRVMDEEFSFDRERQAGVTMDVGQIVVDVLKRYVAEETVVDEAE